MATTFNNLDQTSIIHSPFLNNHQIHDHFKSNPSISIKFPLNHKFTQINCNHSKPITKFLLKPSLKPLITQSTHQNPTIHAFGGFGAPFSDSGWRNASVRGDFRAWSRRRPGSSSGGKKNRVSIALECTRCLGNRYTTEKRRVARVDTRKGKSLKKKKKREDNNGKLVDALVLSKYCPKCRGHFLHKELKIGTSK